MVDESREYFTLETNVDPIVVYDEVVRKPRPLYGTIENLTWLHVWEKIDIFNDGGLKLSTLENILLRTKFADELAPEAITNLLAEADTNGDGYITKEEFIQIIKNTKKTGRLRSLLRSAALTAVPRSGRTARVRRYLDEYSCRPPPLFTLTMTLAQVFTFIYYGVQATEPITAKGPVPLDSPLIYDPRRRYEGWRFVSYMMVHSGWLHIFNNAFLQLVLGIILELVHNWWRVMLVYVVGVVSGCLAASVCSPYTYLAGASGGVYALEYAYVGNLILNWSEMSYPLVQLGGLALLSLVDVSFAVWDTYANPETSNISYMAHLGGALAGVLMGVNVLRNLKKQRWEKYCWGVSVAILGVLVGAAITFHAVATDYFPPPDSSN